MARFWYYAMELVEGVPLSVISDQLQAQSTSVTLVNLDTWETTLSNACAESRQSEKRLSEARAVSRGSGDPLSRESPGTSPSALGPGRGYTRRIVELMAQVAQAAHALHEAGVVHRDIKPGNIIVKADGRYAVLVDLGVAQLADDADGRLTRTREMVGTLRYASPQQVLAVGSLDRRTDIYSLGATLWELLTLRPFLDAGENTPVPVLMERIQHDDPAPLRKYHPGISRDLEAIVHKCVEKVPERRYATAADLAADLNRFLRGESVLARKGRGAKARRLCAKLARSGRLLPYVTLVVLAALCIWIVATRQSGDQSTASADASASSADKTIASTTAPNPVPVDRGKSNATPVVPAPSGQSGSGAPIADDLSEEEYTQFEQATAGHLPEQKFEFLRELKTLDHAERREMLAAMQQVLEARPPIVLTRGPDHRWVVNVGRFSGLRANSVLAIYPPEFQSAMKPMGHVRVDTCGLVNSIVSPVAYSDVPATDNLPNPGRCELAALDFGDFLASLVVDQTNSRLTEEQRGRFAKLETELSARAKRADAPFRVKNAKSHAKWIIQYRGPDLCLLPFDAARDHPRDKVPRGTPVFRIADGTSDEAQVVERVEKIFRVQNLTAVAKEFREVSSTFAVGGVASNRLRSRSCSGSTGITTAKSRRRRFRTSWQSVTSRASIRITTAWSRWTRSPRQSERFQRRGRPPRDGRGFGSSW